MDHRVHPELKSAFSNMPPRDITEETLTDYREEKSEYKNSNDVTIYEQSIPQANDHPSVNVRIYEPKEKEDKLPGVLYIHGGGYILGTAAMSDYTCEKFVLDIGCVVVSVDYRLAPEHPYPAALDDCYAALKWFSNNAPKLNVDPMNIAVVGGSAGGGLAIALTLLARDRQGPSISFQMPLYPMIDDRNNTPSSFEITDRRIWNRDKNELGWKLYLGKNGRTDVSSYAAPARAENLSSLPPTYTCVGTLDLFRDETIHFVHRLIQAGVPTEFHIYPGCFHGFEFANQNAEVSKRAESEYINALKQALLKDNLANSK